MKQPEIHPSFLIIILGVLNNMIVIVTFARMTRNFDEMSDLNSAAQTGLERSGTKPSNQTEWAGKSGTFQRISVLGYCHSRKGIQPISSKTPIVRQVGLQIGLNEQESQVLSNVSLFFGFVTAGRGSNTSLPKPLSALRMVTTGDEDDNNERRSRKRFLGPSWIWTKFLASTRTAAVTEQSRRPLIVVFRRDCQKDQLWHYPHKGIAFSRPGTHFSQVHSIGSSPCLTPLDRIKAGSGLRNLDDTTRRMAIQILAWINFLEVPASDQGQRTNAYATEEDWEIS
jgi:hypothetical protein